VTAPRTQGSLPPFDTYPAIDIENIAPELDGGRWAIKRVVGDTVTVEADIFKEGHDLLSSRVLYREIGAPTWLEAPMAQTINDRWRGEFTVDRNTRYVYTVQAFTDVYGSWRADLQKRLAAAQDVTSELLEGVRLVESAAERATQGDKGRLHGYLARWLDFSGPTATRDAAELAISAELGEVMDRWPDKSDATHYRRELELIVDRPAARFAAWYEIFPRSQGTDPTRSATFAEAEQRIPAIAQMGFDVLYMTPIHPIGHTKRKGPNNTLVAGPNDPGSPYAIAMSRADTRPSPPNWARSTISCTFRTSRASTVWSWRSTLRSRFRPIIRGSRNTRSGSTIGLTARLSSRRIPPKNTRTFIRSTSAHLTGRTCGRHGVTWSCCGQSVVCASSAWTIRTPSRSPSGSG